MKIIFSILILLFSSSISYSKNTDIIHDFKITFDCKLEKIMIKNKDFNYQTFTADNIEVDKKILFPKSYPYTSSTTKILRENFNNLRKQVDRYKILKTNDLVIDIGSNDGTYVFSAGGNKGTGEFTTVNKPAKTLSRFGDSQLDTAQKKFGTASILLDGTEDNVKVPSDDDFGFGTSNWCLEAFIRPGSVTGIQRIFDLRDNSATDTAPTMYLDGTTLHYAVGNTSEISGKQLEINTWYHVALTKNESTTRLFLDGNLVESFTDNNDYGNELSDDEDGAYDEDNDAGTDILETENENDNEDTVEEIVDICEDINEIRKKTIDILNTIINNFSNSITFINRN